MGALAVLVLAEALAGCGPESLRARGGGPGADVDNRGVRIEIHGRTNPAYQVPTVGKGVTK